MVSPAEQLNPHITFCFSYGNVFCTARKFAIEHVLEPKIFHCNTSSAPLAKPCAARVSKKWTKIAKSTGSEKNGV